VGLSALTTYSYRLVADNEFEEEGVTHGGRTVGAEGTFTTASPASVQAVTGAAGAVTATTATLTGAVDPQDFAATYAFELGVYQGAQTVYGVIDSASAPTESAMVAESEPVTGLQPGTTYAYRIVVRGAQSEAVGAPALFTTQGAPVVLSAPISEPLLAVPNTAFPAGGGSEAPKKLTRAQLLARALKACHKQPKRKRASCKRRARRRY
jgi:hypothetical protein